MSDTLQKSILPNGFAPGGRGLGNAAYPYIAVGGGIAVDCVGSNSNYVYSNSGGAGSISNRIGDGTAITIDSAVVSITKPLVVNGRDVMQELDELRDSVLLLTRHVDMEAKYPKLKELKDAYQAQLEKYKTFDALKEST